MLGAVLLGLAVAVLRVSDDAPQSAEPLPPPVSRPERVIRYAAPDVVAPRPGAAPSTPRDIAAAGSPGRARVSWAAVDRAAGYEVRWDGGRRLVATADTEISGLTDGRAYRVEVRAVDAYGRTSEPVAVSVVPGPGDTSWRAGLTGLLDDFPNNTIESSWHLSGYRGCVDLGARSPGEVGLPIDLGCGSDEAVLRARQPMRLPEDSTQDGRVAVSTDAAGPGGRLTLELVPGPADRLSPTPPPGAVRAVLDDAGARITGDRTVTAPAPIRGAGSLHLVELRVTRDGVTLLQDGRVVVSAPGGPRWREASVLIGMRGPEGRRSRVHLAAAGFSGPRTAAPRVVESPVNLATRQVLEPSAVAPSAGIVRRPLTGATAARVVITMATSPGMDLEAVRVQLGTDLLVARQAVPGAVGVVTVLADIPAGLLGPSGPESLTPFVVRAPGAGAGALVQESYLEITSGGAVDVRPSGAARTRPEADALPVATTSLSDSSGAPRLTAGARLVLTVTLNGTAAQWDTGGLEGVQGFQVWLDGRLAAGLPTAGAAGGRYTFGLGALPMGPHAAETRVFGVAGSQSSTLTPFTIE
ncbi:hypothetical protein Acsp05_03530 [Actinokineospora sp. NBRC 105648]|nr:hypothetical protein Acsp05_03530 [Actinokineospora sp. NBRC 105648]